MNNNMALHQHRDQVQKPDNSFQNVEMWIFCCLSICLSACNHGSSVCVRKCVQTLAWWSESDCVGMHECVCVHGCVQGFPQSPSLTAHAGWQMTARALPVSLCVALISSWQHHMRDEWTLAQNGITRLLAVIRSHTKKWKEMVEVIKREKRGRDSPHLSRFN